MKRAVDVGVAFAGLVVGLPIMIVIAMTILLTEGRPILFRQQRTGLHGAPFAIYKFRTMVKNADTLGGHSTLENDTRITRLGSVLRKTSLDELPQVINILLGDMSLVGPRPDTPAQEHDYTPEDWQLRCSVRPGLTGPAQARYRSSATFEQRLACDLDYARQHDLRTDLKIIALTAKQVVSKGGY